MKIGLVNTKVVKGDGQGRVNYEIARAVLRSGHQVALIASDIAPELSSHPSVSWARVSVPRFLPTALLGGLVFAWRSFRWLKKYGYQLDVVHANGFSTWATSDVNTAHFVESTWLHSPLHTARVRRDLYGFYQWLYSVLYARLERRAFLQAKVVVAVSESIRDELMDMGVPGERIRVITNGVDLREFSPGPADRKELGLPEGVLLALFVGDIKVPRKNLETVLTSLVEVPQLHLAVVGSTVRSPYPRLARQLGLAPRVRFLGYRRDIPQLMRAADLFVFPSRYEPHGLVLLEAMASGLPVVTAATVGAANLVGTECGVVIDDADDTGALTAALKTLTEQPESLKRIGQAARVAMEQHSWERMSDQYLQVYEKVAEHKDIVTKIL